MMANYQDPNAGASPYSSTTNLIPREAPPPAYTPGPGPVKETMVKETMPGYPPIDPCPQPSQQSYPYPMYSGGYQSGAPVGAYPAYPNQPPIVQVVPAGSNIIVIGGCPACQVGILEDDFSCLAICCAIVFFPIGILCCLALKEKRCTNCGAVFG